jgi:L-amino acid N-acyltransferase YncA
MILRELRESDLPAIQAIYSHWVRTGVSSFEIEPPDVAEMARRRSAVLDSKLPHIVAEKEGRVAGYAYAALYRPRPAYRFTVEDSIYIDPGFAGQGIGRLLLDRVISDSAAAGFQQMIAVIGGGLENRASVRLHQRCGFEMTGILRSVGFKFNRWLDTALMQRQLTS